ncbi:MAG: alanine racemase [Planctomycetes bacterium]|nr:alanine racemase [Planctomycetota bacterium]
MISERAWAEIDLGALRHNISVIRSKIAPTTDIMLVIKADAYGHGMKTVAMAAQNCDIHSFGVRDSSEALQLRELGVRQRILILGTAIESELERCLESGIEIAIHTNDRVRALRNLVRRGRSRLPGKPRVHLNVDTGMGRLGMPIDSAPKVLDSLLAARHEIELVGIMTHLARPEGAGHPFTLEQHARFAKFLDGARSRGIRFANENRGQTTFVPEEGNGSVRVHIANSAAVFSGLGPLPGFDLGGDIVRPGIAAYGVMPHDIPGAELLQPVMSLRTQIAFLKDIPKGTSVSYGQEWTAHVKSRIATIPIGYFDGIPWRLRGKGVVLIHGKRAPIVGRITMDYVMVDITKIPNAQVGDTVTFFGKDGNETLPVEEIAHAVDTIPYEITCAVGSRVKRVPVGAWTENNRLEVARAAPPPLTVPMSIG